jgi:hypothetical protein
MIRDTFHVSTVLDTHIELLELVQGVHDDPSSWDENVFSEKGEQSLARIAGWQNLVYTPQTTEKNDEA